MRILTVVVWGLFGVLCWGIGASLYDAPKLLEEQQRRVDQFNWAIQGQDGAIKSCPGQYPQYADPEPGQRFLIGCWGKR